MALDTDAVLWALRGLHDPKRGGVRADHVARFMSKDATLSDDYNSDDVTEVLESLVADGTLTHASTTGADEFDGSESSLTPVLYRFAGPESVPVGPDDWDAWLRLGADPLRDLVSDEALPDLSMLMRVYELERERDALSAERETWRRHAESAEQEVSRVRGEGDDLRGRIHELENLLERERVLAEERSAAASRVAEELARARGEGDDLRGRVHKLEYLLERERVLAEERSAAASRMADGLARAGQELERLAPTASVVRFQPTTTRDPKTLRGNWLE